VEIHSELSEASPPGYRGTKTTLLGRDSASERTSERLVSVQASNVLRRDTTEAENIHPGLALMRKTTCFACHAAGAQSKGPPYALVAQQMSL